MFTLLVLGSVLSFAEAPLPAPEAIQKAEKLLREVYGDQISKAKTAAEKLKLAQELVRLAAEDTDPANRYVCAMAARNLAVQAGDAPTALCAVGILVQFAPKEPELTPKEMAQRGHEAWGEAFRQTGREQLAGRITAAEWYLRAQDQLTGLEASIVRSRLQELGLSQYIFAFEFNGKDTEGWRAQPIGRGQEGNHIADLAVKDGCLVGKIVGGDPYLVHTGLNINGSEVTVLEIRMAVTGAKLAQLFWITKNSPQWWSEDRALFFTVQGDGEFHVYRIEVAQHPAWHKKTIIGLRLDPGEWDHQAPRSERFSVDWIRGR